MFLKNFIAALMLLKFIKFKNCKHEIVKTISILFFNFSLLTNFFDMSIVVIFDNFFTFELLFLIDDYQQRSTLNRFSILRVFNFVSRVKREINIVRC